MKKIYRTIALYILSAFLLMTFVVPLMNEPSDMAVIVGTLGLFAFLYCAGMAVYTIGRALNQEPTTEGDS